MPQPLPPPMFSPTPAPWECKFCAVINATIECRGCGAMREHSHILPIILCDHCGKPGTFTIWSVRCPETNQIICTEREVNELRGLLDRHTQHLALRVTFDSQCNVCEGHYRWLHRGMRPEET